MITLHQQIRPILFLMRQAERDNGELRLGDVLDAVGPRGLVVAAMMVAMPFVSPLSLGPITTPASLFLLFAGWRIMAGRGNGGATSRWRGLALPSVFARAMRTWIVRLARRQRWNRKRLAADVSPEFSRRCGAGVLAAAFLLGIPIPLLPLTNTFPALGVSAFCLALLLGSRRWFLAGSAFSLFGALVFAGLGTAVWMIGIEGVGELLDSWRQKLIGS